MSPLWIIPALVLPIGGLAIAVLIRHTAAETRALVTEIDRLGEIAVAAAVVWDGLAETRSLLARRSAPEPVRAAGMATTSH